MMWMLKKFCYLAFVCGLFFLGLQPVSAQAASVLSMRGSAGADQSRLVIELDFAVPYRATLADAPPRLVLELPVAGVDGRVTSGLSHLGVRGVAQAPMGNATRFEFEFKKPIAVVSAFTLPRDGPKPDRLVIDFKSVDDAAFQKELGQTYGTFAPTEVMASSSDKNMDQVLGTLTRPVPRLPETETQDNFSGVPRPMAKPTRGVVRSDDPVVPTARAPRRYIVVVDAGHGGKDPGAVGIKGVREKTITLASAKELARQLEESGRYKVVMTRTTDKFILLHDRVKIARAAKADLFVSLHADMAGNGHTTTGLSIYTLSDQASDEQTERLAAKENKVDLLAGIDLAATSDKDVANILIDLAMRENMNQSRFFAGKVVSAMGTHGVDLLERPHRYAGFAVLKAPDIPSVLVEMGFLSNPFEARRLQDPQHRENLMHGLKQGIDMYFDYLEKNNQM